MAAFTISAKMPLIGTTWSAPSTAPGLGAGVTIAGTITGPSDLSAYTQGPDVGWSTDMVDATDNASGGFKEFLPGLSSGDDIDIPMHADFASSQAWSIITTVFGALGLSRAGDVVRYLDLKSTAAARSATNPSFVAAVYSMGIVPVRGVVGSKAEHALRLKVSGGFAVLTA